MAKFNNRLIILIFFLYVTDLRADYRSEIYSAYVNNKMDHWKNVIDRMEATSNKNNDLILELVNYQYGYIGYCLGFNKEDEAKKYFALAKKNIDILEKSNFKLSIIYAYKSAFYGFRISFNKISAPLNGPRSLDYAAKAIELDRENYLGHVQHGNAMFYMPAAFGGSKKEALASFLKAKSILEKEIKETKGNWNYLNLLILIGQAYTYLDDYDSARSVFENILRLEPGFLYVKDDLYPRLLRKMRSENNHS